MAHHKKKKHPRQRAHCHMCKFWKDGGYSREHQEFESFQAHRQRINLKNDIKEEGF